MNSLDKLREDRSKTREMTIEQAIQFEGQVRFEHGRDKYGKTLDRDDLTIYEWLQHAKEESLDHCRYAEAAMRRLEKLGMSETMLRRAFGLERYQEGAVSLRSFDKTVIFACGFLSAAVLAACLIWYYLS